MNYKLFIQSKDYRYYLYALAACLVLWIFEPYVTDLFKGVSEVFAGCRRMPFVLLVLCVAVGLSVYVCIKVFGNKKQYVSHKQLAFLLFVAIVYAYYRFKSGLPFELWGFSVKGVRLAWTDLLALPLLCRLLQFVLYPRSNGQSLQESLLFSDKAIDRPVDDIFGYQDFVDDMLSDVYCLDLSESYSIGVTGDWGQGKSSYLNLLKNNVESRGDLCVVFSPRASKSTEAIQEDFFRQLSACLFKYHTNLGNNIRRYTKVLSIADDGWFGKMVSALETLDLDDEKAAINNGIKRIGKKLFVIIEDFDRLTAEEILEVMKVIDRNGDFCNTVYVSAYDKRYVNSVLGSYFGNDNAQDYSDKYFQYEYALPPQKSSAIVGFIEEFLNKSVFVEDDYRRASAKAFLESNEKIIVVFLPSLRHAKRFLNVFGPRYLKIKEDVRFDDFFFLTLLRYVDIGTYNALGRLELVIPNSFLDYQEKVFTLARNAEDELKERKGKKQSIEILSRLFPEVNSVKNDYVGRIRWIDSFDLYFYDYRPGKAYVKDLLNLYLENSDEDAFQRIDEGVEKGFATSFIDFLCGRRDYWLVSVQNYFRRFKLLCYLNHKVGRSVQLENEICNSWEKDAAKDMESIISPKDYKERMEEVVREMIPVVPVEMGYLFIQELDSIYDSLGVKRDLLFSFEILTGMAIWAQRYYYQLYGSDAFDYNVAFVLAGIRQKNVLSTVVEPAKQEIVSLMKLHPDEFASKIIELRLESLGGKKLIQISFTSVFLAEQFFPVDGFGFNDWLKLLSSVSARSVLSLVHDYYMSGRRPLRVDALMDEYSEGDFDSLYEAIVNDSNRKLDAAIQGIIEEGSVFDFKGLRYRIGASEEEIKSSINRLVEARAINARYVKLKEEVEPFDNGDFIQIRWDLFVTLKLGIEKTENLFVIESIIDDRQLKLVGFSRLFSVDELRPVFIEDEVSQKIYFDPEMPQPHSVDCRFFMIHFESVFDEQEVSFKQRVEQKGFLFVHEVQHWLREELGSDGLKMSEK